MPIDYRCPHCGAQMNVADQYAGQTGPCSQCGQTITIPGSSGGFPPPPVAGSAGGWSTAAIVLSVVGVCLVGGVVALVALLLPAIQAAREAARRSMCSNNLKQISLALINYHEVHGTFPPAYIADDQGRPMHSWRVLILPFMEGQHIYDQYDFDEPWDGPNNSRLQGMMPPTFACPSHPPPPGTGVTHYMVIVGEDTMFPGDQATDYSMIADGPAQTIQVVESTEEVNWLEPRDLNFDEMSFALNDPAGNAIGSHHPRGANVSYADGSVRFMSGNVDPTVVKRLIQKDDGEAVSLDVSP
jgi:prepilin-type processing-associated H-X9-DG protein